MVVCVHLPMPITRDRVLDYIREAQTSWVSDDDRILIGLNGISSRAEDWLTSKIIYGNGGEMTVAQTGEILLYEPSEEVPQDHDGYFDIIHVEMDKWRRRHGRTWGLPGRRIDILSVSFHTADGIYEPAIGQEAS
jgi:hypothetical protein